MIHPASSDDEQNMRISIQQSLQAIALQLEYPIDQNAAAQLDQEASDLLNHIPHAPITRARLAGTLLVYQVQDTESEEVEWFKAQVQECQDDEAVEELIESIHRIDAL